MGQHSARSLGNTSIPNFASDDSILYIDRYLSWRPPAGQPFVIAAWVYMANLQAYCFMSSAVILPSIFDDGICIMYPGIRCRSANIKISPCSRVIFIWWLWAIARNGYSRNDGCIQTHVLTKCDLVLIQINLSRVFGYLVSNWVAERGKLYILM